ncbi:hypothetical protein JWG39_14680 [Desulforhopalus vacuolatus]|uniref:hypothetical protein n=1 Tax=Desulforhopalus vacuolatus TaxID=40414 RepID=UPI0019626E01|nr:hypothetical protein [Desulforhopalus vacuolatus]MBM9521064.1 hypothetical protein [Desulforhopalus vacuolatus]
MDFVSLGKKAVLTCIVLFCLTGCMQSRGMGGLSSNLDSPDAVATVVENYSDIELPIEMKAVPAKSMGLSTDSFQGGIHEYSGRVDVESLRDYLLASMRNHKWKLVGEASYENTMLAFSKPNRTCLVVLRDGLFGKSVVILYVTVDVTAANRLNPFGEPVTN